MTYTAPSSVANDVNSIMARMRNAMPLDLAYAHYTDNILRVFADELSSVEEALKLWFVGRFVATATGDDLDRWEALHGLSVKPVGITEGKRKERLAAHLIGRFNYLGMNFLDDVARLAYGNRPSVAINSTTGTATLTFSVGLSTDEVNRIVAYCLDSGPAHYQWEVDSDDASSGFVVGQGTVGFTKI